MAMAMAQSEASDSSNGTVARRLTNIKIVQNVLLIWLDPSIDVDNDDCRNSISKLRSVVNTIGTFTDADQCIEFITSMRDEKACMIISGSLGQRIIPCIHDMFQLDSAFVFCGNKKRHENWAKGWSKIKGVFTEITPICEALKQAAHQCEQNAISISFVPTGGDVSKKDLDELDPSFMYTQILKEILLTIQFKEEHIKEFLVYCRNVFAGNPYELKNVDQLQSAYHKKTPIWWYTSECFLYPMLNRALRMVDIDIIIRMGFFIADLHRHIEQLHSKQLNSHNFRNSFMIYRGQGMSKAEFDQMAKIKGGLISFNNFLSTTTDINIALMFAKNNLSNPAMVGVLFMMKIDPSVSTTPFASTADVSHFPIESEVLFAMHTVFRIGDITSTDEDRCLFQVHLTLTSDNDKDLHQLTDRIREETFTDSSGWHRLGLILLKMGQAEKAQQVYEMMLEQSTSENEKGSIYNQLGRTKDNQGEYQEALAFYEKSLRIYKHTLSPTDRTLATLYNNIGAVYQNMGDYPKALSSYEKSLAIWQQSLPSNHPDLGMSYNNIGAVYENMGDYPKALSSYEKALAIRQQSLPPNHPALASSYNNIGLVYQNMGDYPKALSCFERALTIEQQSLPPNHPDLAASYNNIGSVYDSMGDYSKALSSLEKALAIKQQSLPPNHPNLASSYSNIGLLYHKMDKYSEALSFLRKAVDIYQTALPSQHPNRAISYNNIALVHDNMGEYSEALSFHEKVIKIRQEILPPNHPDLATSFNNIGLVYDKLEDCPKALQYYEQAREIYQKTLPANHPHLAAVYNNIGEVYFKMEDYSKALSCYQRALDIQQHSLPPGHPDVRTARENVEKTKKKL